MTDAQTSYSLAIKVIRSAAQDAAVVFPCPDFIALQQEKQV